MYIFVSEKNSLTYLHLDLFERFRSAPEETADKMKQIKQSSTKCFALIFLFCVKLRNKVKKNNFLSTSSDDRK